MPIRMVEDDPQNNKRKTTRRASSGQSSAGGQGGGLGGGIGNLIGSLLPFLLKKPKLLIIVLIVGVILYFFMGKGCDTSGLMNEGGVSSFVRGGELNKEVYEETEIFEALADNKKNPLPEKVSLREFCPTPLNQGQQGSCVAWASAYAARTILEAKRTGKNPNSVKFSPSFMYNQISLDHNSCQGSYIKYAMDNMMGVGAVPFNDFRYDDSDCSRKPSSALIQKAESFKINGFQRLTEESRGKAYELLSIKQNLAKGSPVIIGMMVGGSFMQNMMGKPFWNPTSQDYYKQGFGGHAMCIVGYDDYYEGGSFLLMNSWGTDWGDEGFAWVRYSDFKDFNVESYGLYPMGDANRKAVSSFAGKFGLVLNKNNQMMPIRKVSDNYFETSNRMSKGEKFKMEFENNSTCYTYIFGQETDGSSYVLFPYTPKHSPYCGITGTRLFPRDYSMQIDDLGSKDYMAVVVTRKPIDYDVLNKKITASSESNYVDKVRQAMKGFDQNRTSFSGSSLIEFNTSLSDESAFFVVVGITK